MLRSQESGPAARHRTDTRSAAAAAPAASRNSSARRAPNSHSMASPVPIRSPGHPVTGRSPGPRIASRFAPAAPAEQQLLPRLIRTLLLVVEPNRQRADRSSAGRPAPASSRPAHQIRAAQQRIGYHRSARAAAAMRIVLGCNTITTGTGKIAPTARRLLQSTAKHHEDMPRDRGTGAPCGSGRRATSRSPRPSSSSRNAPRPMQQEHVGRNPLWRIIWMKSCWKSRRSRR